MRLISEFAWLERVRLRQGKWGVIRADKVRVGVVGSMRVWEGGVGKAEGCEWRGK